MSHPAPTLSVDARPTTTSTVPAPVGHHVDIEPLRGCRRVSPNRPAGPEHDELPVTDGRGSR